MAVLTHSTASQYHIRFLSNVGCATQCLLHPVTTHHTPHTSTQSPHTSLLTPHTSHLTPHTSLLTPHTSHHTPHTIHLTLGTDLNSFITNPLGQLQQHFQARERITIHRDTGMVTRDHACEAVCTCTAFPCIVPLCVCAYVQCTCMDIMAYFQVTDLGHNYM